mmetsp:Transcript_104402/g.185651  ORF Transcript_104402/g.185651 Transcript_104402/m.185651 type:complete len:317 (+) Transcript_104402:61-1011(+)|eukprot:CAMPEP_0197622806 /NCGR_PEP_ID=MMETSP1338-20131121/2947_1 /TAXON_ID=43686 ORGANISM="Pelagodinium beii, Strain RCC1491" /NCGR_SAMPLE_ID=MMETSP1338 /ASSEMBLY_ACC=CAM_ASM_000754 /LENGTH=316 /DNA_ID=CAMNT_0043192563 /DNA_START=61 /DNA_END=1011 /DNA_ORIENTATION=-
MTSDQSSVTVAATVGCAVVGLIVAGPVGALIGGGLGHLASRNGHGAPCLELNIARIQIPRGLIVQKQGVTYFSIDIFDSSGQAWRVMRRYSEIRRLRDQLNVAFPFPRKHWFGCHGQKLEARRAQLEAWLSALVLHCQRRGVPARLVPHVQGFFLAGRGVIEPVPGPAAALPAQAVYPVPVQAEQAVEAVAMEKMLVSIHVPPGVQPGQLLGVTVPDGRQLNVVVPASAGPELQLEFDPAAGSLTVVQSTTPVAALQNQTPKTAAQSLEIRVPVPEGVRPGQALLIRVPDGREVQVEVPQGVQAGSSFVAQLEPLS